MNAQTSWMYGIVAEREFRRALANERMRRWPHLAGKNVHAAMAVAAINAYTTEWGDGEMLPDWDYVY